MSSIPTSVKRPTSTPSSVPPCGCSPCHGPPNPSRLLALVPARSARWNDASVRRPLELVVLSPPLVETDEIELRGEGPHAGQKRA